MVLLENSVDELVPVLAALTTSRVLVMDQLLQSLRTFNLLSEFFFPSSKLHFV